MAHSNEGVKKNLQQRKCIKATRKMYQGNKETIRPSPPCDKKYKRLQKLKMLQREISEKYCIGK